MDPNQARDLAARFQALMAAKRAPASRPDTTSPPAPIPTLQTPPTNPQSHPFYSQIQSLSTHITKYQKPDLIDQALDTIDLGTIYSEADTNSATDTTLGYQDHLIKALLRWFKHDFFKWTNAPPCDSCQGETECIGASAPNPIERQAGSDNVEIYRCKSVSTHITRFPRYNDPATLLTWQKGRCGEFANCFTLLCIALGSRARWIWNAEDHVWTEVYSEHLGRWVHCDSCENAWDQPQVYAVGWGKKMSYCFGFSASGAQDVTRRYVREEGQALPRNKAPEDVVKAAIEAVNRRMRLGIDEETMRQYKTEDEAEEVELKGYVEKVVPTKTEEEFPRESGDAAWKAARGEDGSKS